MIRLRIFPIGTPCGAYRKLGVETIAAIGIGAAVAGIAGGTASVISANRSSAAAVENQNSANATNIALAQETNRTQRQIAEETNRTNIELQREQNKFNLEQWNRNNLYNSPEMSKQRLMQAGFNPAMYGSNGQNYSVSPVQQVSLPQQTVPNLVTPSVQSSADTIMQSGLSKASIISNLVGDIARNTDSVTAAKQHEADAKLSITRSDVENSLKDLNIKLKRSEIKLVRGQINRLKSEIDLNDKKMAMVAANIRNLDQDEIAKRIDNMWRSQSWSSSIDLAKSQLRFNDAQISYLQAKLPFEIGVLTSQEAVNRSQAALNKHQIAQVDALASLITAQGEGQSFSNFLLSKYGEAMSWQELNESRSRTNVNLQQANHIEFMTDDFVKYTNVAANMIGTLSGAAMGAFGVKYLKNRPVKITGFHSVK